MKDRIVSSLPGRVRINVKGLLRNDEKAFGIWSELAGYGSISSLKPLLTIIAILFSYTMMMQKLMRTK